MSKRTVTKMNESADIRHEDPAINKMLERIKGDYDANKVLQPKMQKAAELLKDEPDRFASLQTAVDVILADKGRGRVEVFFSYKMQQDKEKAESIVGILNKLTQGRLHIVCAADFSGGDILNETIRTHIVDAHWFILLLPDPSEDWDWCLFETGIFRGAMRSNKLNKVFCLRHFANDQPDQIKEFLSIIAYPDDASEIRDKFLSRICHEDEFFPGMAKLCEFVTSDEIAKAAEDINNLLFPIEARIERQRERFEPFVRLILDLPLTREEIEMLSPKEMEEILDNATFDHQGDKDPGTNRPALTIFGWDVRPETWKVLVAQVKRNEKDHRWVKELCVALRQAAMGKAFTRVHATFRAINEERAVYRPILYAIERYQSGGIAAFLIVFVMNVAAAGDERSPQEEGFEGYQKIAHSMRQSHRFAWEVVEPFKNCDFMPRSMVELRTVYNRIMQEYLSRARYKTKDLARYFGPAKKSVERLHRNLKQFCRRLEALTESENASADQADELRKLLNWFEPINLQYLRLSSKWVAEKNEALWNNATNGAQAATPVVRRARLMNRTDMRKKKTKATT